MCPQCNAPLTPHRFASSIVCAYCGATVKLDEASVSASIFHEAFRAWNSPNSYQISSWITIGNRHWALEKLIAQGEFADVYTARLARWPTELVIVKLLRDRQDAKRFDNEWNALQSLQESDAPGADTFTRLIPQPVLHGDITAGSFSGRRVSVFRWASGVYHTFDEVIRAYPGGIAPRASIWVWRRILEVLSFIHASGMAHGAVIPANLLVQENDHGVRLVGYSLAGQLNEKLGAVSPASAAFYPKPAQSWPTLTPQLDLVLSARCIAALMGGDPETATLPGTVPTRLAEIVRRIALSQPGAAAGVHGSTMHAWAIREELGQIAQEVFGPPRFIPIKMP